MPSSNTPQSRRPVAIASHYAVVDMTDVADYLGAATRGVLENLNVSGGSVRVIQHVVELPDDAPAALRNDAVKALPAIDDTPEVYADVYGTDAQKHGTVGLNTTRFAQLVEQQRYTLYTRLDGSFALVPPGVKVPSSWRKPRMIGA